MQLVWSSRFYTGQPDINFKWGWLRNTLFSEWPNSLVDHSFDKNICFRQTSGFLISSLSKFLFFFPEPLMCDMMFLRARSHYLDQQGRIYCDNHDHQRPVWLELEWIMFFWIVMSIIHVTSNKVRHNSLTALITIFMALPPYITRDNILNEFDVEHPG